MTNETIKNQAELEIEALADVFRIATSGFDDFYKEAEKKDKGDSSKAASSGYSSKAASSGNYSTAASSGDSSTAASSGYSSKAASSGDSSTAASSGYSSTAASSGYSSKAASSGDSSKAASSGDSSTAASSGYSSKAASSGDSSACAAVGYRAAVKGDLGNLIMASEYANRDGKIIPIGGKADIVDGKTIKANQWYIVESGKWVAVDFTDGIFSRVISIRNGVKKVRTENDKILFIVSDDNGNHAHGDTIVEARESLIYKNIAKFDGKLPKSATGKEWIGIYRAVTGACAAGVKMFVDQTGKSLDDTYTTKQIMTLTKGHFGAEAFASKVRGEK